MITIKINNPPPEALYWLCDVAYFDPDEDDFNHQISNPLPLGGSFSFQPSQWTAIGTIGFLKDLPRNEANWLAEYQYYSPGAWLDDGQTYIYDAATHKLTGGYPLEPGATPGETTPLDKLPPEEVPPSTTPPGEGGLPPTLPPDALQTKGVGVWPWIIGAGALVGLVKSRK